MGKGKESASSTESKKSSKSSKPQAVSSKTVKTSGGNGKGDNSVDDPHFIVCGCGGSYMNMKYDPYCGSPRLRHCNTAGHIDWVRSGDPNRNSVWRAKK